MSKALVAIMPNVLFEEMSASLSPIEAVLAKEFVDDRPIFLKDPCVVMYIKEDDFLYWFSELYIDGAAKKIAKQRNIEYRTQYWSDAARNIISKIHDLQKIHAAVVYEMEDGQ
jgi:hypothetical protein